MKTARNFLVAVLVFKADSKHLGVFLERPDESNTELYLVYDEHEYSRKDYYPLRGGRLGQRLSLPQTAAVKGLIDTKLIVHNPSSWSEPNSKIPPDAIVGFTLSDLTISKPQVIFVPPPRSFIQGVIVTKGAIWVNLIKDASSELVIIQPSRSKWVAKRVERSQKGSIQFEGASHLGNFVIVSTEDFLSPDQLVYLGVNGRTQVLASRERAFNSDGMAVKMYAATSYDGTRVPYFVVTPKGFDKSKTYPTMMFGYGAARYSAQPFYLGNIGHDWIEAGGVFVSTVLRGGGEFGDKWRTEGMKLNKQNTFEDFIAIAKDLIKRGITKPEQLGAYGTSWGGLLVCASMVKRPDLFKAVAPLMPMTDMINFTQFPVGESWTGEFGDPKDPEVMKVLSSYSPFHNLKEGVRYPTTLFVTSTNDDRMHPVHSRIMARKLQLLGQKVYHYEMISGGHTGAATKAEAARRWAGIFSFFRKELGLK